MWGGTGPSLLEDTAYAFESYVLPALFFFFFQSHQKWHQEGGKIEVQFIKQAAETFLGHGRCFCLGAKMFSYEITKQHHRLLGDFVLLVI